MGERMLKTWKALVAALLLPLLVVAVAACGSSSDDSSSSTTSSVAESPAARVAGIDTAKVKKDLTVGVDNPYYLFHEDVIVAQEKGYFREFGIDNVRIVETENPLPALIGGSLDFMLYDTDTTMAAASKSGTTLPYLAVYLGGEANILGVGPGIDSAEDLKGKTLTGGQFDSRNDFLIRQILRENGIDPEKDVKLVSTGGQSNERLQAVIAGTVDGASLQIRHRKLLEDAGGKFLFVRTQRVPQVGWSASPDMSKDPDTMAAFLAATLRARQFIDDQRNKDAVISIMRDKRFDLPPDYIEAYPDENNTSYHVVDGGFDPADMDRFVREQIDLRVIPPGTDWRKLVNLEPLWTAQRAIGVPLDPDPSEMR
jgi:ABC-type nitrate/sulfonate/bicarbonate transport system substrate-binding protein